LEVPVTKSPYNIRSAVRVMRVVERGEEAVLYRMSTGGFFLYRTGPVVDRVKPLTELAVRRLISEAADRLEIEKALAELATLEPSIRRRSLF
jgi:hypothetical protein